ncbi:MAG: 50S ribosomal protein L25 [Parcubacteria group bacterium]|nr:50S ribosomal protein L25 [Parcubacteria group bacterium]
MQKLTAEKRDLKTRAQQVRLTGKIPAVFYGRKTKSTPVAIPQGDFLKVWREAGESSIVNLSYDGKDLSVLIYDVAFDPVKDTPTHVDFYVVEADRAVEVPVPITFIGEAPVQKQEGVSVVKVLHEIKIKGLPKDLPQVLTVDLSVLQTIEDQIFAKDVKLPTGITLMANPEEIIAAVSVAKAEVEEAPVEEFDPTKIEVEKKGKLPEEGVEGGEAKVEAGGAPKPKAEGGKKEKDK